MMRKKEEEPVLTGGMLGSFWKHRKDTAAKARERKPPRKSPRAFSRELPQKEKETQTREERRKSIDL